MKQSLNPLQLDIFSREGAEEALASAEEVFNACNKVTGEIFEWRRSWHISQDMI